MSRVEEAVNVRCPQCLAEYAYDDARFGGAEKKRLRCPKCSAVFEVLNPALEALDATEVAGELGETVHRRLEQRTGKIPVEVEAPELPPLAALPRDLRFSLAVIAGEQAGSVFKIVKPRNFIGRGGNMDVRLSDTEVSRRHAMLEVRGETATLVDLESTNGTFVDGERIDRATLRHQGEFTIGATTLMYIVTPAG